MVSEDVKLERAVITDLVFGCLSLALAFPNMMQAYLDVKKKKRDGCGLLQKWYHNALWFGGVVSFTASILLNVSTGGIVAAVSITLNDVLAWLFTISLSYTTFVELQVSYNTCTMTEFPKWPQYVIYFLNVITIILWLIGVLVMSLADPRSIFKCPAYLLNAFCLFGLTVTIAIASWKLIQLNNQVERSLSDCERLKRSVDPQTAKKMVAFKRFTGSVIFVALVIMSWIIYSATRILLLGTSQFVTPQRTYNGVATAVASRFVCFVVMSIFTYRMWLWDGFPTCGLRKPKQVIVVTSTTESKKSRNSARSSQLPRGSQTTYNGSVVAEPSQINRLSIHSPSHSPDNGNTHMLEPDNVTSTMEITETELKTPTESIPLQNLSSLSSSKRQTEQEPQAQQAQHQTEEPQQLPGTIPGTIESNSSSSASFKNNDRDVVSSPHSSTRTSVIEEKQVSISLDLSVGVGQVELVGGTLDQGSPIMEPEETDAIQKTQVEQEHPKKHNRCEVILCCG